MAYSLRGAVPSVLALLATVSRAENPPTSLWPAEACTDKSFSIPSWTIRDFASNASVSFTLTNRVTEESSSLSCPISAGECTGIKGDELKVTVQINDGSAQISVEDAWTCNDKKTLHDEPKTCVFYWRG